MQIDDSLEQAMVQVAAIIIPLGQELGGPSAGTAGALLAHPLKSFFGLCLLYLVGFILLRLCTKILLGILRAAVTSVTMAVSSGRLWYFRMLRRRLRRVSRKRRARCRPTRTRIEEASCSFESWEEFSRRFTMSEKRHSGPRSEVDKALMVLGVTSLATEQEIRKAYLRLVKRYHPDHFMHAPASEQEHLKNTTVRIRQAYDTLTSHFCQVR
jgi:hypothetical protein